MRDSIESAINLIGYAVDGKDGKQGSCAVHQAAHTGVAGGIRTLQSFEAVDFFSSERAKFTGRNIQRERPKLGALDFFHMVADGLEHAPDLAVAAFDQD